MQILNKKIIIVTGAGSGIGRALTLQLVNMGATIAAVDIHNDALEETKTLAGDRRTAITSFVANIADTSTVDALPNTVVKQLGALDGIINNAGIIQPFVRINDLDYAVIQRVMDVNFFGPLRLIKSSLPILLQRPEAHIVNISSMGGFLPVPGQSVYGASKAAIKLLTEGLYAELAQTRVRVSAVFPGAIKTNITTNSGVQVPTFAQSDSKKQNFKALSAEIAADIIIKGIQNNKPLIFVGRDSRMMNLLYRLSPVFATNVIAKQMRSLLPNT